MAWHQDRRTFRLTEVPEIDFTTIPGCDRLADVGAVDLTEADIKADHPVMRDVSLAGVRLARLSPWKFGKNDLQEVLKARNTMMHFRPEDPTEQEVRLELLKAMADLVAGVLEARGGSDSHTVAGDWGAA